MIPKTMSDFPETPLQSKPSPETATQGEESLKTEESSANIVDYTNRKVIVYNVPKYSKDNELKELISEWLEGSKIEIMKIKKPPKKNWVVLTLSTEDMVDPLLSILNDGKHLNKKAGIIRATKASEKNEKRSREEGDKTNGNKRARRDDYVKTPDEIRDVLTPLWRLTYEEQVELKTKNMINKCLSKIVKEIKSKIRILQKDKQRQQSRKQSGDSLYDWLKNKQPIHLDPISKAPKQFQYRNKSELTFGFRHTYSTEKCEKAQEESDQLELNNEEAHIKKIVKTPAVGFLAGGWSGGVSSPHFASNIPDIVCGIADIINEFLRESPIPPYTADDHRGIWRTITIRSSERTKQCMVVICHAPASGGDGARSDGSDDYSSVFEKEKERLVKMLTDKIPKPKRELSGPGTEQISNTEEIDEYCNYQVTSLFFQEFGGLSNPPPQHPVQHLYGGQFLEERLLQCTFQISPGAFFQVTTEGAEILYKVVIDKLKEVTTNSKDTLLFDVCCGTGTIGLTCMKEGAVGKVVGIDISEPAIKDAIINAEKNGYLGTEGCTKFVASRAEHAMYSEIKAAGRGIPMVAVVDPAREGLHPDVCKALRNEKSINRIIYVSCNPTGSLVKDAGLLCSPETKKYTGKPFKITSAQPVDMFPLTDHCEMVMVFDRMSSTDFSEEGKETNTIKEGMESNKAEQGEIEAESTSQKETETKSDLDTSEAKTVIDTREE